MSSLFCKCGGELYLYEQLINPDNIVLTLSCKKCGDVRNYILPYEDLPDKDMLNKGLEEKIIDESHFNFHVLAKSKIINSILRLKKGFGFFYTLAKLKFESDDRWKGKSMIGRDANLIVFRELFENYKEFETRPSRKKIVVPFIEWFLTAYGNDPFVRERVDYFLVQVLKRQSELKFYEQFSNPMNWYPRKRNLIFKDGEVQFDMYEIENSEDYPDICDQYHQWYGLDIERAIWNSNEQKEDLIKKGKEYVKEYRK